jgi:large subunit ribosomal protein L34e
MTKPMLRNKRFRKSQKRTPGKRKSRIYSAKRTGAHRCALCGTPMTSVTSTGPKSSKTQSRIYGGNLCHACLSAVLKYAARVKSGAFKASDVPIRYRELATKAQVKI